MTFDFSFLSLFTGDAVVTVRQYWRGPDTVDVQRTDLGQDNGQHRRTAWAEEHWANVSHSGLL